MKEKNKSHIINTPNNNEKNYNECSNKNNNIIYHFTMSSKARMKEIRKMLGDGGDLNEMFEEMLGLRAADPEIIRPKFVRVRDEIRAIYKVLHQLGNFVPLREDFPKMQQGMDEILTFATAMRDELMLDEPENEDKYKPLEKNGMNELYKALKNNRFVKTLITLCGKLKAYHKYFENASQLKDNFIGQEPGLSFYIFPFASFDLKLLWASDGIKPIIKKYILTILHNLYKYLFNIYKTVTSPDVDIDRFTAVIMTSIEEIKKVPRLSRCKRAFRRIEQSVELLQKNFDQYYRDSVSSENMCVILENFICDVSSQGGTDTKLLFEFKTIISYMHEMSEKSGQSKNPQVQKIFKTLKKTFETVERQTSFDDVDDDPSEDKPAEFTETQMQTRIAAMMKPTYTPPSNYVAPPPVRVTTNTAVIEEEDESEI